MGKDNKLLKAIKEKDSNKIQKLLNANVKDVQSWQSVDCRQRTQVELRHINVNVKDESTGCTPLLLAVLYGLREAAERLIFHCADVNAKDNKGNTALHLAAFHGSLDLVKLLLSNNAERLVGLEEAFSNLLLCSPFFQMLLVNVQNEDGNTALHIACQAAMDERVQIITQLIRAGVNVWTKNKHSLTALDVSAQYKRNDVIATLLEYVPALKDNRTALIEASIRGFESTVELLLEYGIHSNSLDENYGSSALHEAVRYNRYGVAHILLAFQANPYLLNLKRETPSSLAVMLPPHSAEIMNKLFKEQTEKMLRIPTMIKSSDSPSSQDFDNKEYVLQITQGFLMTLHGHRTAHFSVVLARKRTLTHISLMSAFVSDNLTTFWVLPVLHHGWTILDLHFEHLITGITVYGWNSPKMLKSFQLQISGSMEGPWTIASSHTCQLLGSSDPREPAVPQTFSGFKFRSRYIRFYLVDNHNGNCICFQGIQLHGVDYRIISTLQKCGLGNNINSFILQGINTWKNLLDMAETMMDNLVTDSEKKADLWETILTERRAMYPMKNLAWLIPPATSVFAGDIMPDFSIQSDVGVSEVVQLIVQGAEITGNTFMHLTPMGEKKPSSAVFSNISLNPAGVYLLLVKGVFTDITLVSPTHTEVRPRLRSELDIASTFDEIQKMLSEVQATFSPASQK